MCEEEAAFGKVYTINWLYCNISAHGQSHMA